MAKSDDDYQEVEIPLYLGLSLHGEAGLFTKMKDMLVSSLERLVEFGQSSSMLVQTQEAVSSVWGKDS